MWCSKVLQLALKTQWSLLGELEGLNDAAYQKLLAACQLTPTLEQQCNEVQGCQVDRWWAPGIDHNYIAVNQEEDQHGS